MVSPGTIAIPLLRFPGKLYREDHTFFKVIVGNINAKINSRRTAKESATVDSDDEQTEDGDDVAYALSSASGTESDTNISDDGDSMDSWSSEIEEHDRFTFDEDYGVHDDVCSCGDPIDFFKLLGKSCRSWGHLH
ncbi:unnamed protein product [Haemonchus placei]|uniref:ORF2 n=1 Tax=Haemonchus placei TaxID=6290 RepID=A0A0N4W1V9_HAEPC|nr:unnamed protein product [Haemonchus placei]